MNSKDYRNIREAYLNVYEQEEVLDENREMSRDPEGSERRRTRSRQPDPSKPDFTGIGNMSIDQIRKMSARIEKEKTKKESYDLYNIILSHLLDEGYADTQEAAERIMVNMSEEWRESIVETRSII